MNKKLISKLKELKPIIKERYGVDRLAVFGSQARSDYSSQSDIDIVIFSMKTKSFDLFMDLKYFLEKQLDKKVDLGFYSSMKNFIKQEIDKDMIYV